MFRMGPDWADGQVVRKALHGAVMSKPVVLRVMGMYVLISRTKDVGGGNVVVAELRQAFGCYFWVLIVAVSWARKVAVE